MFFIFGINFENQTESVIFYHKVLIIVYHNRSSFRFILIKIVILYQIELLYFNSGNPESPKVSLFTTSNGNLTWTEGFTKATKKEKEKKSSEISQKNRCFFILSQSGLKKELQWLFWGYQNAQISIILQYIVI